MQLISIVTVVVALAASVNAGTVQKIGVLSGNSMMDSSSYNSPMDNSSPSKDMSPSPSYNNPSPAMSAASSGKTHCVSVGGSAGLLFSPESVVAAMGDTVLFQFGTKNHTLTQSTFAEPCVEMPNGSNSGFMPTDGSSMPTFSVVVTVTTPQWFYCQQSGHCQKGMVFAINPATSGDKTFNNYKANAMGMGASTVTATAITATTIAVPPPSAPPAPPPMPVGSVAGTNIGTNGQCFCVCNMALGNGVPNAAIQGLGTFGGSVGQVQSPFAAGQVGAPPPASAASAAPPPAASAAPPPASMAMPPPPAGSALAGAGLGSINSGTVIPFQNAGTATMMNAPAPAPAPAPTPDGSNGAAPPVNNGLTSDAATFAANPPGGAAGK